MFPWKGKKLRAFVVRQWKGARLFAALSFAIAPLGALSKLSNDKMTSHDESWQIVSFSIGLLIFNVVLVEVIRRWFNFMAGEQVCKWWWQR